MTNISEDEIKTDFLHWHTLWAKTMRGTILEHGMYVHQTENRHTILYSHIHTLATTWLKVPKCNKHIAVKSHIYSELTYTSVLVTVPQLRKKKIYKQVMKNESRKENEILKFSSIKMRQYVFWLSSVMQMKQPFHYLFQEGLASCLLVTLHFDYCTILNTTGSDDKTTTLL